MVVGGKKETHVNLRLMRKLRPHITHSSSKHTRLMRPPHPNLPTHFLSILHMRHIVQMCMLVRANGYMWRTGLAREESTEVPCQRGSSEFVVEGCGAEGRVEHYVEGGDVCWFAYTHKQVA